MPRLNERRSAAAISQRGRPALPSRPPSLHSPIPAQRRPVGRSSGARIAEAIYKDAYRICNDEWQKAVEWRLAGALDERVWDRVRRHPSGLCVLLAQAAGDVEEVAATAGEAAGLAAATAVRWFRLPKLVQKIAQVIVVNTVPPIGEDLTATLARFLRIIGIWICISERRPLTSCACFEALVSGQTQEWIQKRLEQELAGLRASAVS